MLERVTATEAASMIGVHPDTLARWNKRDDNDAPRPIARVNSRRFYSKSEVLCWLALRVERKPVRRKQKQKRAA